MPIESEPFEGRRAHTEAAGRVETELHSYWQTMLNDEAELTRVATILGRTQEQVAKLPAPPLRVSSNQSNVGAAEVGLIVATWLTTEVLLGVFKDLAKEELKRRLKLLWAHVSERIDDQLGGRATGWPAALPPEPTLPQTPPSPSTRRE